MRYCTSKRCFVDWEKAKIDKSPISNRAKHMLKVEGYETAGDLMDLTPRDLARIPNIGALCAADIVFWVRSLIDLTVDPDKSLKDLMNDRPTDFGHHTPVQPDRR